MYKIIAESRLTRVVKRLVNMEQDKVSFMTYVTLILASVSMHEFIQYS